MSDQVALDYEYFKTKIYRKTGLDLNAYKQGQMERRLRSTMERAGAQNFAQYYRMLEKDEALLEEFMNRVTINVSELFRNPEQFKILENFVLPELLSRPCALRIWSAGCSYGQEPYSLAACVEDAAPRKGHTVFATDIDEKALENSRKGVFAFTDGGNIAGMRKDRWFTRDGNSIIADKRLQAMIKVSKLNLLTDPFPKSLDLILCRNVVIYFTESAKDELYRRFYAALKPGGYLFVGGTERITGYAEMGYTNPYPFFYHKPLDR